MKEWISNELQPLTSESLNLLYEGKIPGILVRNFMNEELCQKISKRIEEMGLHSFTCSNSHADKLVCQYAEVREGSKERYFTSSEEARKIVRILFEGICENPIEQVKRILSEKTGFDVNAFEEDGFGEYFAGTIRNIRAHGRLHFDYVPLDHASRQDWAVSDIEGQLSWNVYFKIPEDGGDYWFSDAVVSNGKQFSTKPQVGDLIFFNSRNYHEVLSKGGARYTQTSFVGLRPDGTLGCWS